MVEFVSFKDGAAALPFCNCISASAIVFEVPFAIKDPVTVRDPPTLAFALVVKD